MINHKRINGVIKEAGGTGGAEGEGSRVEGVGTGRVGESKTNGYSEHEVVSPTDTHTTGRLIISCVRVEIKRDGFKAAGRRGLSGVITSHAYIGARRHTCIAAKAIYRFYDADCKKNK